MASSATDLPFMVTKKRHFNIKPQHQYTYRSVETGRTAAVSSSSPGLAANYALNITRRQLKSTSSGGTKMTTKLYGRDLREYEELDIDSLLSKLTPEELEELNNEVDPDNHLLPPHARCRDQTTKEPTGPLDRSKLLRFLEEQAKNEKDWDELVPYKPNAQRGKAFVQKEMTTNDDDDVPINLDVEEELALTEATDQDLADLAAYLGMHSILSQTQYWNAIKLGRQDPDDTSHSGVVRSTIPKVLPDEPPNTTDVEDCIQRLSANDKKLHEVNINNMKEIPKERIRALIDAVKNSTHLEHFAMANTAVKDEDVVGLVEAIESNKTLKIVNVESNFISPEMVAKLVRATLKTQSLIEFHAANQRAEILGNQVEMDIVEAIEENDTLLRVGLAFESMGARHRVAEAMERNYERIRLRRLGEDV